MKQRTFENRHQQQWQTLEQWLDNDKPKAQFPQLYRQICQHLALAKDRHYTPHLINRLNILALRGHQQLYQAKPYLINRIVNLISVNFPIRVRAESYLVGLASFLFIVPLLIMFIGIQIAPDFIYYLIDVEQVAQIERMYAPTAEHFGHNRESDSDFLMFGFYIYNNIGIGFQTFASGILFGFGSIFFLVFNGLYIGAVAGHLTQIGYIIPFYSFVVGHSSFELIAIILSGMAGLKLGWALLAPGRYYRLQALHNAAKSSIKIMVGVIVMLILAAFIEAFWSSNSAIEPLIKYIVGGTLWTTVIGYLVLVGRNYAT
ncbi:MAG: stage II sporulation protein M [Candidatus Marithrix sp.]